MIYEENFYLVGGCLNIFSLLHSYIIYFIKIYIIYLFYNATIKQFNIVYLFDLINCLCCNNIYLLICFNCKYLFLYFKYFFR